MRYQVTETYFDTPLFRETVQNYFDTVLGALFTDHSLTETKGLYIKDNVEIFRSFDMSYPIHILNGLIPTLHVYEQFLQKNGAEGEPESEIWLKVFMLGFTLHDANKLVRVAEQKGKSELELALEQLRADVVNFRVQEFFPAFDQYQNEVFHLALATENRTRILANEYPASRFTRETLAPLCHLADGLASIKEVESPAAVFESIRRKLTALEGVFGPLPVSYVEVHPNPYTLTSQNLLQASRKVLYVNDKKVLFALRTGFVFFGKDVTAEERVKIQKNFLNQNDLDPVGLTKVDAQKCEFGFLGSLPFTPEVLDKVADGLQNQFLALSPNGRDKIGDFDGFVDFLKKFFSTFSPADQFINVVLDEKTRSKIYLRFAKGDDPESDGAWFQNIYILHKIQWLNAGKNKIWGADFAQWMDAARSEGKQSQHISLLSAEQTDLPTSFEHGGDVMATLADVANFLKGCTNSSGHLLKTLLCLAKTWHTVFESEVDLAEYTSQLQANIIAAFSTSQNGEVAGDNNFFAKHFSCRGMERDLLTNYQPSIPRKADMCLFSGAKAGGAYTEGVAFGVKARGFSNRTVTSLNNNSSAISSWFSEENKLRISKFPQQAEANLCFYTDFFETSLDIDRDIIAAVVKAKSHDLKIVDGGAIQFDKSSRFQPNLFNLDFISLAPKVKDTFWQVRRWLLMVKKLGLRVYVTGIMSPYAPHEAAFYFENAPDYLRNLKWHQVRLDKVEQVLEEMKLAIGFGIDRIPANLLQIATSRLAYFRLFYRLEAKEQDKVRGALTSFIFTHPHHFLPSMTTIEQLVELALKIEVATLKSSGATETWLIRTATDMLRTYAKQERPREEIIAKISGEIYRVMKNKPMWTQTEIGNESESRVQKSRPQSASEKIKSIEDFAAAVYDLLFAGAWQGKLPTANVQKDWTYEFAFIFKKRSMELREERKRNKDGDNENAAPAGE